MYVFIWKISQFDLKNIRKYLFLGIYNFVITHKPQLLSFFLSLLNIYLFIATTALKVQVFSVPLFLYFCLQWFLFAIIVTVVG